MFGSEPRIRRPILFIIVFGAFLALAGITATTQAGIVSAHLTAATLNGVVGSDAATTRAFVNAYVQPAWFEPGVGLTAAQRARLESQLGVLVRPGEILRVELRLPDGTILAANEPGLNGTAMAPVPAFTLATGGKAQAEIVAAESAAAGPGSLAAQTLLREFLPLISDGQVLGVVGVWRDAGPILARIAQVRGDVVLITLSAAIIAAALLYLVFRAAQARLSRQTTALVEAIRRDPLTNTLNHGALVGHLALEIERARPAGQSLGIALIDVDNFRLLNDNHGHEAGDETLVALVDLLSRELPNAVVRGRYGPDEFLLVAPPELVAELGPAVDRVRTALSGLSLQFDSTERLPVTISAGLCTYPDHGASVTAILSTAALALEEAKASGGDAVRVPSTGEEPADRSGFDVLQGLVLAVDTKDRYTKRHSEDVARYAVFLAEQVGLDPELIRTIKVAGLLHDVGKIGIPDPILRKPGRLTAEEMAVVKQHVALGDMIVRDLPDIDAVRAGIRFHHERWDGEGYLDGLEGDGIPLVARIIAVGDVFSAMTTTRPYRKALDVREALKRLEDAAGTQLEERLVRAFVDGLETAPNPPLPGDAGAALLWLPGRRVA
ncbi:MAG TPA: diguanylate cyclase [Candidatus Limnocylindrales bacterium]|nr:diguanylate cyclase [Candidatus Limnocylindrales bacterium]